MRKVLQATLVALLAFAFVTGFGGAANGLSAASDP